MQPRTMRAPLVAAALALLAVWPAAQTQTSTPPPPSQQPPFRAGVELVSLNVTVTDGTNKYVTDLERDDFAVYEDGVKQDVTFFNKTNLPIALALLLDT